jgi:heme exporter protein CcmD
MPATAHIDFVVAAYAAGLIVIVALIAWVTLDYRVQRRVLTELERQGLSRRSTTLRDAAQAAREDA